MPLLPPRKWLLLACLSGIVMGLVPPMIAQPARTSPKPPPVRASSCPASGAQADTLQEAIDAGEALPAPLRADALIRIADKMKGRCPKQAYELLENAFEQAESVKELSAYRSIARVVDSRAGTEAKVASQGMDRLSLQSKAILVLVSFRPADAIRLFRRIATPRPEAVGCSNLAVPDVSIYYKTLDKVLELLQEKSAGAPGKVAAFELLQNAVQSTTAPEQLAPLLRTLDHVAISRSELSQLVDSLAVRVEVFPVDDRTLSTVGPGAVESIDKLSRLPGTPNYPLLHSFEKYMRNSLHGAHCSSVAKSEISTMPVYEAFNRTLASATSGIEELPLNSISPAVEQSGDEIGYWKSKRSQELLTSAKHLNFDDSWIKYVSDQTNSSDWRARIDSILNDIHGWGESEEANAIDYYHERCILIHGILTRLPATDPMYGKALDELVTTFEASSLQTERPAEWYWEIAMLVRASRRDKSGNMSQAVLAALARSKNGYLPAVSVLMNVLE